MYIPIECARHNALIEDEVQETVCHQASRHPHPPTAICASLISAPVFHSHSVVCRWKGTGKVITLKSIKVVSVAVIAGGYC